MDARFRCMGCAWEWTGLQGPNLPAPNIHENNPDTICPACGSLYMTWLNYKDMRRDGF